MAEPYPRPARITYRSAAAGNLIQNASTVTLAPAHTRDLNWVMPTTGGPGFDGVTDVAVTVRVTSDQPVVVGANFQF